MKLKNKIRILYSILRCRLLDMRIPVSVSWTLTHRCNHRCSYCNIYNIKIQELTTKQILLIIDQLKELGTERIGFTGGEPLLRDDIGEIINYAHDKKIFTGIVSNGSFVQTKIEQIRRLDLLQLSLDGNKEVNDKQRYEGSFDDVIKAIKIAKKYGIKVWITYVLTKYNLSEVNYVVNLAKKYNAKIFFQPIVNYKSCGLIANNLLPDQQEYKDIIKKLIEIKKTNNFIGNSHNGLKYLYHWPHYKPLKCFAGRLFFHITPSGNIYPCFNIDNKKCIKYNGNLKDSIEKLESPKCDSCWTYANIEFNLLFGLHTENIVNTLKLIGN